MPARCLVVALLLTAGVCPAVAQSTQQRGLFRGLFGGAQPVASREHVLDFTVSAFAAYVKQLHVEADENAIPESTFQGANASLTYLRSWTTASVGVYANGGTAYVAERRDFDESPWVNRWTVGAHAGGSRQIGRRTTLQVDATASYSPYYGFGFGGGRGGGIGQGLFTGGFGVGPDRVESIPGLDTTVARQPTINGTGRVSVSRALSSRSSLSGYYNVSQVLFLESESGFVDQRSQVVGARYQRSITRYVAMRAGYGYRRSSYGSAGEPFSSHDIDVGLDGGYGREFQIARRTTFSFDTRSSMFVSDQVSGDESFDPRTRLFVGGSAALSHRWGRTWQAEARYDRTAGLQDGFRDPVFANRATATVRGVPLRRLDVIALASHVIGEVGFTTADREFSTTTGTAQLRLAVLRNLAAYAQYFYYRYNFERGVVLPGLVQPRLDRQGASVGLTLWLPLL